MSGGAAPQGRDAVRQDDARIVLVETSDALPGLLPFQAWDVLGTADAIYVRDREAHPATPHLYFAGLDLLDLPPAALGREDMDLSKPGSPAERKLAKALIERALEHDSVVYLLGPGDEGFGKVVGTAAIGRDIELEFVFMVQQPAGGELLRLVEVTRALRDPEDGCPWDLQQDHLSLRPHLVEETYELLDAITSGVDRDIREELGDVLMQVILHAQLGADRGAFTIDDVARDITDKLVRRHPHVFADGEATTPGEVNANWEVIKQAEKGRTGPFEGVPTGQPALALAHAVQRRAAKRGFDWRDASEPTDRVREELDELAAATTAAEREEELGDLLGAVVGLARHLDVDPELAMRAAATKFVRRFEAVLAGAASAGTEPAALDRDAWLALWDQVKRDERG